MLWPAVIAAVIAGFAAWAATGLALRLLRQRQIMDHPNARSSHAVPTPRGGGIAVIVVLALGWLAAGMIDPDGLARTWPVLLLGLALATLSFVDDLRGLPVAVRFGAQAVAVIVAVSLLPAERPVFQGLLPPLADRLAAGLLWLWFINLFNFMDGIDGITAVETFTIGAGVAIAALLLALPPDLVLIGATAAGTAVGFALWNWQPARIFLGDVGSVGLGFLLGWLLLELAGRGAWLPAMILPLYYLADATLTLLRRLLQGETPWHAHRSHFYQWAARGLSSHARVAGLILGLNLGLIGLAAWSAQAPAAGGLALTAAVAATLLLLWYFRSLRRKASDVG